MKKVLAILAVLLLVVGIAPTILLAQGQGGSRGGGGSGASGSSSRSSGINDQDRTQDQDQIRDRDRIQDPTTHDGDEPVQDRDRDREQDQDRLQDRVFDFDQAQDKFTPITNPIRDIDRDRDRDRIRIELETASSTASTSAQLREMIRERERELEREASSTGYNRNGVRNENQVRLAVHALLASENMLGGLGPQVSEIARSMNQSVENTINAEMRIQDRGALTKFFFGGDKDAGQELLREINQNENRIQELGELIGLSTNAELRLELENWLQVMKEEQSRLRAVADEALNGGGVFSWRF